MEPGRRQPDRGNASALDVFSAARPDAGARQGAQAVAANFDAVLIVTSLNLEFNERRLERYVTLAMQSGAEPVVVLTKADLCPDFSGQFAAALRTARGAKTFAVSAFTGFGLENLAPYITPQKILVLIGSSGVGKSSLVNALAGEPLMEVRAIRADDAHGRHTTTHRQLLLLPSGAMIIDTPGMRELGMWDVHEGLGAAFGDVERFARMCRFGNCRHEYEPGCAVRAAVENGELPEERLRSYIKLRREARFSDKKEHFAQRMTEKRNRSLAEETKKRERQVNGDDFV